MALSLPGHSKGPSCLDAVAVLRGPVAPGTSASFRQCSFQGSCRSASRRPLCAKARGFGKPTSALAHHNLVAGPVHDASRFTLRYRLPESAGPASPATPPVYPKVGRTKCDIARGSGDIGRCKSLALLKAGVFLCMVAAVKEDRSTCRPMRPHSKCDLRHRLP
jgi:hypothetical protein